ncbi:MAG: rhomboid family intramembrane serine protease [Xanthomonadales bacterium]
MRDGVVTAWSDRPPRPPYAAIGFIAVACFMFFIYSGLSPIRQQVMIEVAGMEPARMAALLHGPATGWWDVSALSLVTALLIHANWLHLLGNLVFFWVFGMNVERRVGAAGLVVVLLLGGALANVIVALRLPSLTTPIIGASGAVSAVVGAYLGLFPRRRIGLYLPLGLYLQFARVPAVIVIGSWFTLQLLYTAFGPINATVAWWTHLAGFALGLSFAFLARGLFHIRL